MTFLVVIAVLLLLGGPPALKWWRERLRKREDGWRLVGWRRYRFGFELRFKNGTVVRNHYYYPSGHFVGPFDQLHNRIVVIEKQLEFGQHAELEIRDAPMENEVSDALSKR
jgi:hypothetical protein